MPASKARRVRQPSISTTGDRPIAQPQSLPFYSVAVPPIPRSRARRRREAPAMSLAADRTAYRVSEGEAPSYSVANAEPDQRILWTLSRDGIELLRDHAFDAATDSSGQWTGQGSAWQAEHVGFWDITARTGDRRATVRLLVQAGPGGPAAVPVSDILGVSHVAGRYRFATRDSELTPETFLVEGAKHIRNIGARNLFVHLSPQYRVEYPFDDFGSRRIRSLTELAATPQFRKLLELPFECVILTAYSFAHWDWIQGRGQRGGPAFDAEAETREFADLTRHLLETYPDKRFVIKNWEGDWQLKHSLDLDAVATEAQVSEFIEFLRARHSGVAAGRGGDDRALFAIEFNLIHLAQRGARCMLSSVIPEVESDLLSYSSWWTLAKPGDLERNIADDLAFVRSLPGIGGRPVIVTEFGFPGKEEAQGEQARIAAQAFANAGVPLAIYWEIFDNVDDIGLVGRKAVRLPTWHALRALIGAHNDAEFVPDLTQIPESLEAGRPTRLKVAVRNKGMLFDPVLGYALGLFDENGRLRQTVWIKQEVAEGESVELSFLLRAPAQAGTYSLRMFQHGVELFGEEFRVEIEAAPTRSRGKARRR